MTMGKFWGRVDPEGRNTLRTADAVQKNARDYDRKGLTEAQTQKIIDKVVKTVNIDQWKGKK